MPNNNPESPYQTYPPDAAPNIDVVVTTGDVTPNNQPPNIQWLADQNDLAMYPDYQIRGRYESDPKLFMMSATANSSLGSQSQQSSLPSIAFVQLAMPTLLWVVDWTICRLSDQPVAPSPTPATSDWTVLGQQYHTAAIMLSPDGTTPIYRFSGTYIYGCNISTTDVFEKCRFAIPPYINQAVIPNRYMLGANAQVGII